MREETDKRGLEDVLGMCVFFSDKLSTPSNLPMTLFSGRPDFLTFLSLKCVSLSVERIYVIKSTLIVCRSLNDFKPSHRLEMCLLL